MSLTQCSSAIQFPHPRRQPTLINLCVLFGHMQVNMFIEYFLPSMSVVTYYKCWSDNMFRCLPSFHYILTKWPICPNSHPATNSFSFHILRFACMVPWSQKRVSHPRELEIRMVVRPHVGSRNYSQTLCKSRKCLLSLWAISSAPQFSSFQKPLKTQYKQGCSLFSEESRTQTLVTLYDNWFFRFLSLFLWKHKPDRDGAFITNSLMPSIPSHSISDCLNEHQHVLL